MKKKKSVFKKDEVIQFGIVPQKYELGFGISKEMQADNINYDIMKKMMESFRIQQEIQGYKMIDDIDRMYDEDCYFDEDEDEFLT